MTTKQSIFPDMPRENPATDKEGNFMPLWEIGLSALFQALQQNFKNEGILVPPLTDSQMTSIQGLYASFVGGLYNTLTQNQPDISGQTIYDSTTETTNQFVVGQDSSTPPKVNFAKWVPFAMLLTNNGDPNGAPPGTPAVAGELNWLCYDTSRSGSDPHLWICTTSGSTGADPISSPLPPAVWQQI